MPRDDAELLARAGRGDPSAFATLYNMYEADLYRFSLYLADNPDEAEELFQETWFRAVKNLGKKQIADFKKWLLTIAANFYRDELRKRRTRSRVLVDEPIENPRGDNGPEYLPAAAREKPSDMEGYAIREALDKAMKNLTQQQRAVFVLTYVEGFKIREAGEILGKPEGTIKSTLHKVLSILREALKEFR